MISKSDSQLKILLALFSQHDLFWIETF